MYALIEFAGKQFKIEEGNTIKVPYIDEKVGTKVVIDKILYMDDGKNKKVGDPSLKNIQIDSKIESHGRDKKIVVFKFKRRKGYQKKNTHRQDYSILKVGKLSNKAKSVAKSSETNSVKKAASKKPAVKKAAPKKPIAKKKEKTV